MPGEDIARARIARSPLSTINPRGNFALTYLMYITSLRILTQHSPAARFTVCLEQPIQPVEPSLCLVNLRKARPVHILLGGTRQVGLLIRTFGGVPKDPQHVC